MKPLLHAKISVKTHGGHVDDYMPIHNFIDSSKATMPDIRHRAILHSAFGCYITEQVFGNYITNSQGKQISVRDIAEEHILQDLGFIPTVEQYLNNMTIQPWMSGTMKKSENKPKKKIILLEDDFVPQELNQEKIKEIFGSIKRDYEAEDRERRKSFPKDGGIYVD